MIQAAASAGVLPTMGIGEVKVPTLQFADDILIFFDGSLRSARILKVILDAFSTCSGLRINYAKSALVPIHLSTAEAADLAELFDCATQDFPLQYLGLPLSPRRLPKAAFLPLVERIDARLAVWKGATLSKGGRLILINSVLSSIPSYFSSTFLLPTWVIKAIDKIRRAFFWRGKNHTTGFHCLAKWEHICRPKVIGGLGIRNLQAANSALLMRALWNFFKARNLPWVQLLMNKHYRSKSLDLSSSPAGSCPVWKDILKCAAPFLTSVDFAPGDGKHISFWNMRWCRDLTPRFRFPFLYKASRQKHISVYKWMLCFGAKAYLGFDAPLNSAECSEVEQLSALISDTYLSGATQDSMKWRWNSSGRFTVREAYDFLVFDGIINCPLPYLWKLKLPLKVKLFLWLALKNKVLTAEILIKRGCQGPSICVMCNADAETIDHLVLHCTLANSVWNHLLQDYSADLPRRPPPGSLADSWTLWRSLLEGERKKFFDIVFAAGCWELWKERNRRIFDNRSEGSVKLARRIRWTAGQWVFALAL